MGLYSNDRAEAGVIAEVLLIAAAIAGAAALSLSFTIAQALPNIEWGGLTFLLDGTKLTYSTALATNNTYCVAVGATCLSSDPARDVAAGQQVRIHHTTLSGKTILVVENASNAILYQKVLGG